MSNVVETTNRQGASPTDAAPVFYLVVPCYNEQEMLPTTTQVLGAKLTELVDAGLAAPASRVVYVDDGSSDDTWQLIASTHEADPRFCGVKLSRNRGHQNALLAGLEFSASRADVIGSMDADLQDDVNALNEMLARTREGYEVVYGVRSSRETDTGFKRTTAQGFYKFQHAMGVQSVYNHADFRVMSARAVQGLLSFGEVNLFLRGMVPQVGYRSCTVEYERAARAAGESKYPLRKMLSFAIDGITSFSTKPMRIIAILGMVISVLGLGVLIYALIANFAFNDTVRGWTSTIASIWFLGGLQLLAIGVVGEYVGKTYLESKHRPRYLIDTVLEDD